MEGSSTGMIISPHGSNLTSPFCLWSEVFITLHPSIRCNHQFICGISMVYNMNIQTSKLLYDHQHRLPKFEPPAKKLLHRISLLDEIDSTNKYLDIMIEKTLSYNKVDLRNKRSIGVWVPQDKCVKLTKIHGKFEYGHQNRHGKFLRLLEALYLLEMNKLEVFYENMPMSIMDAYEKLEEHFFNHLLFKKLMLHGCKFISQDSLETDTDVSQGPDIKRQKLTHVQDASVEENILNILRKNSPTTCTSHNINDKKLMFNISKEIKKVKVRIRTRSFYEVTDFDADPSLYAFSISNNLGLYRFVNVEIPVIPMIE